MESFDLKLPSVMENDFESALDKMLEKIEATERENWNNLSEGIKKYTFKVDEMSAVNQKKVFEFIDSIKHS